MAQDDEPVPCSATCIRMPFVWTVRGGLLGIDSNVNATMAAIWACLALPMVFAELANSLHDIRTNLPTPASLRSESAPAYFTTS